MLDDFVLLQNLIEDAQRAAAIDHEIFGDDFEPVDDGLAGENVLVVGNPEADANSVVGVSVEAICRHY